MKNKIRVSITDEEMKMLPNRICCRFHLTDPLLMSMPLGDTIGDDELFPTVTLKRYGMPLSGWVELEITDKEVIRQVAEMVGDKCLGIE